MVNLKDLALPLAIVIAGMAIRHGSISSAATIADSQSMEKRYLRCVQALRDDLITEWMAENKGARYGSKEYREYQEFAIAKAREYCRSGVMHGAL